MKIRNIAFGYQYADGVIIIYPKEANVFLRFTMLYMNGNSLQKIADIFNEEKIEYMPGVTGWNKARLMRFIEDDRYIGAKGYPPLIDRETREKLLSIKQQRNTQPELDRRAAIYNIGVPIICTLCGTDMKRINEIYRQKIVRWKCKNCHVEVPVSDAALLNRITTIINDVIDKPDTISMTENAVEDSVSGVRAMEKEIDRMMEQRADPVEIRNKILECASIRYSEIGEESHISQKLKAEFIGRTPLSSFSPELCHRTVKNIRLDKDGTVQLTLLNGQVIGKEKMN